tara:strand:- start:3605 stop:3946 length:342 start_codon:yes stop_codon:yes gene_type:complete
MRKYWDFCVTVSIFVGGIVALIFSIASLFGIISKSYFEDSGFSPVEFSLITFLAGLFSLRVFWHSLGELKKYDWEDDFIYLFLMTVPIKIIRKLSFHKQKIKKQLKKDYHDEK